jgi:hypothetical protein
MQGQQCLSSALTNPTSLSLMMSVSSPGVETTHGLAGFWWFVGKSGKLTLT